MSGSIRRALPSLVNGVLGTIPENIPFWSRPGERGCLHLKELSNYGAAERAVLAPEVFNLGHNHPQYGTPNTAQGNTAFGTITATTVVEARLIQFGLKLIFLVRNGETDFVSGLPKFSVGCHTCFPVWQHSRIKVPFESPRSKMFSASDFHDSFRNDCLPARYSGDRGRTPTRVRKAMLSNFFTGTT